jgi:MFS family permease
MLTSANSPSAKGSAAFQFSGFRLYQIARFCIVFCTEMQSVAVGWQVYEITKRPLDLGLTGLAQFLPGIFLFLVAGHITDRFDRRKLLTLCYVGFALSSALLLFVTLNEEMLHRPGSVRPIFAILCLVGAVRSFSMPASRALLPQLVPEEQFQNAVAWNSSIFQGATILGPALGGVLYATFRGPLPVYATAMMAGLVAVVTTMRIETRSTPRAREPFSLRAVFAGFHYIWAHKLILGSISLDLFAVLLGGAVALLPVYAKGNSDEWPVGTGLVAKRTGIWSGDDGVAAGVSADSQARGCDDVVVRGGIWRVHDCVWIFAELAIVDDFAGICGRGGHGQRGGARRVDSGRDAGRNARAGERGRHDFHWRFE